MLTRDNFGDCIVAQDDDCDYDESGWIAVVHEGVAYLSNYGHCSCYGTWTALGGGNYSTPQMNELPANWYTWSGSVAEMVSMAERKADPAMPDREMGENDCDYDHLMKVYEEIVKQKNSLI